MVAAVTAVPVHHLEDQALAQDRGQAQARGRVVRITAHEPAVYHQKRFAATPAFPRPLPAARCLARCIPITVHPRNDA